MKIKSVVLFFIFLFPIYSFSQIQGEDEVYLDGDLIEPKFKGGGLEKLYEFINQEFDYSKVTKAGKMIVSFTIDKTGVLNNIRVLQYNDVQSAAEIFRVLYKAPNWVAAKRGGKPVSLEMKIPLEFKLKEPVLINSRITNNAQTSDKVFSDSSNKSDGINSVKNSGNKATGTETKPEYSPGLSRFYQFIAQNYRTPDVEGLKGKVIVSFVVDTDGTLTDFKVIKDLGFGTGIEAIRVLKMSPKWTPGTQNGVPIRCQYSLPINISSQ